MGFPETFKALSAPERREILVMLKKGKMSASLDGAPVRQADLNEVFGEPDVFLSIFNPLYFIEELADYKRHLLLRTGQAERAIGENCASERCKCLWFTMLRRRCGHGKRDVRRTWRVWWTG